MSRAARRPLRPGSRRLRCAIYTRKSSEEGLEQAFNSLHAQREACEAFIKSQRHEGWACLPQAFDDGGLSGATMERPALQQLLADIQAGRIDVVVVYKVDRLTRSLADFAKIVEIFDAKGVSFVSVTQQFNTTTSMGRLTLNVLLSFAQFEREVTGERIRDKIAASKRKGMWMGGVPPLGYGARDRKLVVIEREAETVRHIFGRYSALGSVRLLKEELEARGITGKLWTSASGRSWGGKPIGRGALYLMLQNRIYRGEIVHKEQSFSGEHPPIIDAAVWNAVQARLAANAAEHGSGEKAKNPSLLAGIVFDGDGHRMTPSHAVKKGVRYRYYVSHPLITGTRTDSPAARRVPATEIEQIVTSRIRRWLSQPADILAAIASQVTDATDQRHLIDRAAALAGSWSELAPARQRAALAALIKRVDIAVDRVDIQLLPTRLVPMLGEALGEKLPIYDGRTDEPALVLSVPARVRRAGRGMKMLVEGRAPDGGTANPDPTLIKLIVRAYVFRDKLLQSGGKHVASEGTPSSSYIIRLARLSFLAPDIVGAILDGHQPRGLTTERLIDHSRLPLDWRQQRSLLGFA